MRISRSESPSPLPSLDSLPPMENLWALEAEREACLHGEDDLRQSEKGEGQRDGSCCWISSKRLQIDGELFYRRGVGEDSIIKNAEPGLHKNGEHYLFARYGDSRSALRHTERVKNGMRRFTSASRCYPPSVEAQRTDQFSTVTEAVNKGVHSYRTLRECSGKGMRTSGSIMHLSQSDQNGLASKSEDHFLLGQNGSNEHGRHLRKPSFRQGRDRCSNGAKISLKEDLESRMDFSGHMRAGRKRYNAAVAYRDAIRKRYDNATAYNADNSSTSKENNIQGPHILEPSTNKGLHVQETNHRVEQCSDENMSEVPKTMDIVDDAETIGVTSPATNCDNGNKISRKPSITTSSSVPRSLPAVFVDVTNRFELHVAPGMKEDAEETDAHRLSQRQRQIEYGKNTLGYECYVELVPRLKRKARDPQTPNPKQVCSKRSWDGQIRKWRRLLHVYDPPSEDGEEIAEDLSVLKLQRVCAEEIKSDAAATTTLPKRICESNGVTDNNSVEEMMGMQDANLTIYDDWMEV
ncbi:hypothetical protein GOP47_0018504 [Adiantum capillus-veneris]|uniref:Histone RNA hairpin-binding protein RNA-binding domain-containing protein n=1 Tax=Adiantum capillus-veneris TaxID=13818 RepID=A0A9D4UDP1_ADICA|nr:hypothetical protein GOP47_0018504 [Adiantum capillus-veneris]